MRLRISDYNITVNPIADPSVIGISFNTTLDVSSLSTESQLRNAIRLVVDETQKYVMTSSMQKDKIFSISVIDYPGSEDVSTGIYMEFLLNDFPNVSDSDDMTIEVDLGETLNVTTTEVLDINKKMGEFVGNETVKSYLQQIIKEYSEAKQLIVEALNSIEIPADMDNTWATLAKYIQDIKVVATPITDASIKEIFDRIDQGELN